MPGVLQHLAAEHISLREAAETARQQAERALQPAVDVASAIDAANAISAALCQ